MTRLVNVHRDSSWDVLIDRSTPWGNPFVVGVHARTRDEVIAMFRAHVLARPELMARARAALRGRVLGCHCAPKTCHGDVWVEVCDRLAP